MTSHAEIVFPDVQTVLRDKRDAQLCDIYEGVRELSTNALVLADDLVCLKVGNEIGLIDCYAYCLGILLPFSDISILHHSYQVWHGSSLNSFESFKNEIAANGLAICQEAYVQNSLYYAVDVSSRKSRLTCFAWVAQGDRDYFYTHRYMLASSQDAADFLIPALKLIF